MKKIIKKILDLVGLENLRFSWEFPRCSTKAIKDNLGGDLIGVEIGVWKGRNAKSILEHIPRINKLYLIDPYVTYHDYNRSIQSHKRFDSIKVGKKVYDKAPEKALAEAEKQAQKAVKDHQNKVVWVKKFSSKALNDVPDNLDFVYIDGNHEYAYIKDDIENYYRKLREGGILSGHDATSWEFKGVLKAVIEFVSKKNLELNIGVDDWWIVKGEPNGS